MAVTRRRFIAGSLLGNGAAALGGCGSSATSAVSDGAVGSYDSSDLPLGQGGAGGSGVSAPSVDARAGSDEGSSVDAHALPADVGTGAPADRPASAGRLAMRMLGRTGVSVSLLGFGTAPLGSDNSTPDMVTRTVGLAIDLGITYLDTAPNYGSTTQRYGNAEMKLAPILKTRRQDVFLVTKVEPTQPTRDGILRQLEQSLRRLGVDNVDAAHIHNLGVWDLTQVMGPNGTIAGLLEAKKRGLIRFLGTSGHQGITKFAPVIDTDEIDLTMNTLNFVDRDTPQYNFEDMVLPTARRRNTGIVGMKILGGGINWAYDGRTAGNFAAFHERAIRYALDIPNLATALVGFSNEAEVRKAVDVARAYAPLNPDERSTLLAQGRTLAAGRRTYF